MKPYSIDLRQKIVDAYSNQEGSYRQLAQRFRVSKACLVEKERWKKITKLQRKNRKR